MAEKSTKTMKSFRLDKATANYLKRAASNLEISQAEVINLALTAFAEFGVENALSNATYKHGTPTKDYELIIIGAARGDGIYCDIMEQIDASAEFEKMYDKRHRQ